MAQIDGSKIIFDGSDWLAGLHPRFNTSSSATPLPKSDNKLSSSLSFNPYRFFGMASPGFFPTTATNASVVTSTAIRTIQMGAESTTYYGYGINSGPLLFQISVAGALTSSGTWPHTITPAANSAEGQDVAFYSAKVGGTRASRIFYSYNNTTSATWDVGVYSLDGATFDDDFMSTAPATPLVPASRVNPHPMIVGDDDQLYIGDGNLLHAYDGANAADNDGKFFNAVLTLPANFRITSFAKYQRNLVIFGYKELATAQSAQPSDFSTTDSIAFFWDYISLDPYDAKKLNDNYVSCGFDYNGTVGCFTSGRKLVEGNPQFAKVMLFNGAYFEPVSVFANNPPFHGAVEVLGDTISWVSDGIVHLHGPPYPGAPSGLNRVTQGAGSSNGAIRTLSTTVQVISTGAESLGGLDIINTGFRTGFVTTAPAMPMFDDYKIGKVRAVKVYFGKTSLADKQFDLYILSDFGGLTQIYSSSDAITAANQVLRITTALNGSSGSLPRFTSLAVLLNWSGGNGTAAAIVDRIEVEFESVTFNNS